MSFDLPYGVDFLQFVQCTGNIGPSQDPVDDKSGVLFQKDAVGVHVPKESFFKYPFYGFVPFDAQIDMYASFFHFNTKLRHYYITQYMCQSFHFTEKPIALSWVQKTGMVYHLAGKMSTAKQPTKY